MSIMVAVGRGAKEGVLVKNAETMEIMEKVSALVVDKTGTLTEGKPRVTDILAAPTLDEREMLQYAASVEQNSEHPLGRAIVAAARERHLDLNAPSEFVSTTGGGVEGFVDGKAVLVGSPDFLESRRISVELIHRQHAEQLQRKGSTVIFVAIDGRFAGRMAITDPIKPTSGDAVNALRRMGLELIMLTGDNEHTAQAVAAQLGIEQVRARVKPQDKYQYVNELRVAGRVVAMAGDGINDAPALAAANVGIAMGTGTDIAIESADIVLVRGDLHGIVRAFNLSRRAMRNIRQNLFFAFLYNVLGVPIAAGILVPFFGMAAHLSPIVAAAAMSFSSVSVIANALRLRFVRLT
jgi:Cu+-exporting ATPase